MLLYYQSSRLSMRNLPKILRKSWGSTGSTYNVIKRSVFIGRSLKAEFINREFYLRGVYSSPSLSRSKPTLIWRYVSQGSNKTETKEETESRVDEDIHVKKTLSERLDSATKPLITFLVTLSVLAWLASNRDEDQDEAEKPDHGTGIEGFISSSIYNIKKNTSQLLTFDTYESKILPDPLPPPYTKPLSLFIELDGLLATLKWDKSIGWRIYTRPGVKEMLTGLGRFYEVILYVNAPAHLGDPVCQSFDPQFFYSTYRLYRDHMVYKNNCYTKDLSKMNRDLSKTIVLDVDPDSVQLQSRNSIIIDKWDGDENDRVLPKLERLLVELYVLHSLQGESDIRNILSQVKAIESPSLIESWKKYKDNLRQEYNRRLAESQPHRSLFFRKGLIRRNANSSRNIVDLVENIAMEERAAYIKESQAHLETIIQAQKKQEEMIRQHLEESKNKGLRLWDYFTGDALQPTNPVQSDSSGS